MQKKKTEEESGRMKMEKSTRKVQRDSATTGPSENASSLVPGRGTEWANV